MPDVDEAIEYLITYWHDMDMAAQGGYGSSILSSQEIQAWQQGSCTYLDPWEFGVIRNMSREYVHMLSEGSIPETKAPYGESIDNVDREKVDKALRGIFGALMQKKAGK